LVYLNNAATTWPKPDCVLKALNDAAAGLPQGQFRGTGSSIDVFAELKKELAALFHTSDPARFVMTSGATDSLNYLIRGLGIPADEYCITATEHNSVLRPLYNIPGIAVDPGPVVVPCDRHGIVDPDLMEKSLRAGTKVILLNHCSNVTGAVQNAKAVGEIARRHGLIFLLDTSQSAGCLPVDIDGWGVDGLVFTGHKSLLGVQGTGGFYAGARLHLAPVRFGGTGRNSRQITYDFQDPADIEYETGTQNGPGAAALLAGVRWILEKSVEKIAGEEHAKMTALIDFLENLPGITVFGADAKNHGPVLSFRADRFSPSDLSYILQNSYGIVTRTGLHCAPLIHRFIGSDPGGTVRISVSPFTTEEDILSFEEAMREIMS
jgi:selenocysteine lyase/cysteine desulfurase